MVEPLRFCLSAHTNLKLVFSNTSSLGQVLVIPAEHPAQAFGGGINANGHKLGVCQHSVDDSVLV